MPRIVDVVNSTGTAVKRVEFNRVLIYQGPLAQRSHEMKPM